MEVINLTKIVRTGNSCAIIIPKEILDAYGWQRGDTMLFVFAGPNALLVKRPSDIELRQLKSMSPLAPQVGDSFTHE